MLDDSSFLTKDSLNTTTFLQAYWNWLTVVDCLANNSLTGGFHSHCDHMIANPCFNMHLSAWCIFDEMLCLQFIIKSFLIDTKDLIYFVLFKHYGNFFSQSFNFHVSTPSNSFSN